MRAPSGFPRILLYRDPMDMRKQIIGLGAVIESILAENPFADCLFVFCNRRRDILKALYFDTAGFCLWTKRLDKGRFPWVPKAGQNKIELSPADLDLVFSGVDVFKRHEKLEFETLL